VRESLEEELTLPKSAEDGKFILTMAIIIRRPRPSHGNVCQKKAGEENGACLKSHKNLFDKKDADR
jgi:hypothetical protein